MNIKLLYLKLRRKIGNFFNPSINSDEFNEILKKKDITIGESTVFYGADSMVVDVKRPWLLCIGSYTKIAQGTIILTHDYSRSVLRRKYNDILCESKKTIIGNNVFIGVNSIILMGTQIGDNVIVGAGSVVSGVVPDNVVIAGNPAKIIRTLDEHYEIRKKKQLEEAKICVKEYYSKYNKYPTIKEMGAFFPLFLKREKSELQKYDISLKWGGDLEDELMDCFMNSTPMFESYEEFLNTVMADVESEGKCIHI